MKKCIKILNMRYLDFDGVDISIGGVQTYITNLALVAKELGMSVEVYQFANKDFCKLYQHILVHGIKLNMKWNLRKKSLVLYRHCMKDFHSEDDLLIFGTDLMVTKHKSPFAIAIQHGIGWDIESETPCSRFQNVIHSLRQFRRGLITTQNAANVGKMICVDYNYVNWYRTQILHREMEYAVIPNFTDIPPINLEKFENNSTVKIIFARRLVKYRGTRLFAAAVERLLSEFDHLEITIAGDGPEEAYLKKRFEAYKNVKFITYKSEESLAIHRDQHIAVVPTVGSEGTSLSLLEAMASSCAVICTNVGGMTNIVIDHFNGRIINPDSDQLYSALKQLIEDHNFRKRLAKEAYCTVQCGFSLDIWKQKWRTVLQSIE